MPSTTSPSMCQSVQASQALWFLMPATTNVCLPSQRKVQDISKENFLEQSSLCKRTPLDEKISEEHLRVSHFDMFNYL